MAQSQNISLKSANHHKTYYNVIFFGYYQRNVVLGFLKNKK
jgi:hypothetical protein